MSTIHNVIELLVAKEYVVVISMDCTKAFNSVRYSAITDMLSIYVPDNIFNWFANYIEGRKHRTTFDWKISSVASINASVVQESIVGPAKFVFGTSDLHPVSNHNRLLKYADDSYLLIGSSNIGTRSAELAHMRDWAATKYLKINP